MENKIGNYLDTQIKQRGWSMRELARRSGVSHAQISNVINGLAHPDADFVIGVAKGLHVDPVDLLRLAGHLPPTVDQVRASDPALAEIITTYHNLPPERQQATLLVLRGLAEQPPRTTDQSPGTLPTAVGPVPTTTGKEPYSAEALDKISDKVDEKRITLRTGTNELVLSDGGRDVIVALANALAKLATADQLDLASVLAEQLLQKQLASGDTRETLNGGKQRSDQVDAGIPAVQDADRGVEPQ